MKNFFKKHRKPIIITASVLTAVILAAAAVVLTVKFTKKAFLQNRAYSYINESDYASIIEVSGEDDALAVQNTEPQIPLVITSPSAKDTTVKESVFAIIGTSDPQKPLLLNGNEVARLESGEFSVDVSLKPGSNIFTFEYDNTTVTYNIRYDFTVIKAYAPFEKKSYEAGSSFVVTACARVNSSSVTASFNGQKINLTAQPYAEGEEYTDFTGTFTLPTGNDSDINLGSVSFTAVCQGVVDSYSSPAVICLRDKALDGTRIVEVVASQAETFDGNTTDDWSRPTNSYLPQGTVDYMVGGIVYESESGNSYYNLRCGKRVYITKKNAPDPERVTVSKCYQGELPEYNNISLVSNEAVGKHTTFTFNTDWRAPFAVEIAPQNYNNPAIRDYGFTSITYGYVDIKFFYAAGIAENAAFVENPLFSSMQIIPASDGVILRLYLKRVGAFYGWNAEYNSAGQLVFSFLNPTEVVAQNNLNGVKIVIDAGHGGRDIGAPGLQPQTMCEAERNLSLAFKLKSRLESYGATVVMTRSDNVSMSSDARCEFLRREAPDLCISLHHDSSTRSSASGASFYSFNAFSGKALKNICDRTLQAGIYGKTQIGWHYFYLARVTSCPVVLIENGFISNSQDFAGISDENTNNAKADAITLGVLDYFNSFVK